MAPAKITSDSGKMQTVSKELDGLHNNLKSNLNKMDEYMGTVRKLWQSEAATTYTNNYQNHATDLQGLAAAMQTCSQTLAGIAQSYDKADRDAQDAIQSMMGGGR